MFFLVWRNCPDAPLWIAKRCVFLACVVLIVGFAKKLEGKKNFSPSEACGCGRL